MRPIELLICDDHPIFREGIRSVLKSSSEVVVVADAVNGDDCLQKIESHQPDVILLDIRMPIMNGIECLKSIKAQKLKPKVITLTQFDEKRLIKQMLRYGSDGYLFKDSGHEEIIKACRQVTRGHNYYSSEVKAKLMGSNLSIQTDTLFPNISEKEKEVLWRICSEQSSKQIADYMCISIKTIENHRSSLFKKIGVFNLAGLVKWAVLNHFDLP